MIFPVLAPAISSSSDASGSSPTSNSRPTKRRLSFPLLSNSDSNESATTGSSPRSWFSFKRRDSNESPASVEAKLVKAVTKLDRKEREKREKATKKVEKELRLRARQERDARAYAAWLEEQKLYYSTGRRDGKQDDDFYPHGVWTGAYLF
ncbi:uncharacterized protein JCM15063_000237 [Sporobolomyces koalae]|uniref:uncharacterized protein n=1 Tax=Sporobolomyces koalae TaxID=500713 RepID=UPI0031807B80